MKEEESVEPKLDLSEYDFVRSYLAHAIMLGFNEEDIWDTVHLAETAAEFCVAVDALEQLANTVRAYYGRDPIVIDKGEQE